jgi:hypothetical protein
MWRKHCAVLKRSVNGLVLKVIWSACFPVSVRSVLVFSYFLHFTVSSLILLLFLVLLGDFIPIFVWLANKPHRGIFHHISDL